MVPLASITVDLSAGRRLYPQPAGLGIQLCVQFGVVRVHVDRRPRQFLELGPPADVIDVRVRDHDGLYREPVPAEDLDDLRDIIAWIDDDGLTGLLIAKDRTIALQHPYRQNLVNH